MAKLCHRKSGKSNNGTGHWRASCKKAIRFFVIAYTQAADLTLRQFENGSEHALLPLNVPTSADRTNLGHRAHERSMRLIVFRYRRLERGDVTRITRWIELEFSGLNIRTRDLGQCDDRNLWSAADKRSGRWSTGWQ